MKLLLRNLDRTTTETQLLELFKVYGPVQYCTIVMDEKTSQSKGFGFVEMPNAGHAKSAMKNLNGYQLGDCKIRVKRAEDKNPD